MAVSTAEAAKAPRLTFDPPGATPEEKVAWLYKQAAFAGLPLEYVSATTIMETVRGIGKGHVMEIRKEVEAMNLAPADAPAPAAPPEEDRAVDRPTQALESIANSLGVLAKVAMRLGEPRTEPLPEPVQEPIRSHSRAGPILAAVGIVAGIGGYFAMFPSYLGAVPGGVLLVAGLVLTARRSFSGGMKLDPMTEPEQGMEV